VSWKTRAENGKLKAKGDDRTDQQKIGAFLKGLRKEKNMTQEQLAEKLNVTGRTVSRWETGVNLPDLSLLVELADYYGVDIREIIDGERKSESMEPETKETLLKVSDYAEADKKRTVKKTKRRVTVLWIAGIVFAVLTLLILNLIFGNPVSKALAKHNAQPILDIRFGRDAYQVVSADYSDDWLENQEYYVRCEKPGSPDSNFTITFGMFGNYLYDNYIGAVLQKGNVLTRVDREYHEIVVAAMENPGDGINLDYCYGSVFTGDNEADGPQFQRLTADQLELDQVFNYREIGRKYGEVVVALEDTDLSADRIASLLLQLKAHLNRQGVEFQAMSVSLMDRSAYDMAAVWDFPCDQIYETGLVQRVAAAMNAE
jgi:transcriptional regulator with XRE-family HTH domain